MNTLARALTRQRMYGDDGDDGDDHVDVRAARTHVFKDLPFFILNTLRNESIRARLAPARLPCALKHHVTAPYAREHHDTATCALKRHAFSSCALKHLFIARGAY